MLISRTHCQPFIGRELSQGRHLREHLKGPRQKSFGDSAGPLDKLRHQNRWNMNAHNGYSRALWFRHVASAFTHELEASAPAFLTSRPIYFMTIMSSEHCYFPKDCDDDTHSNTELKRVTSAIQSELYDFSSIGEIDIGFYPYASPNGADLLPSMISPHAHLLVWGSKSKIDRRVEELRRKWRSPITFGTSVDLQEVRSGDLLQMIWYVCKMPRQQRQRWARKNSAGYNDRGRKINGVNSVRLFAELEDFSLSNLVLSSGRGTKVFRRARRTLERAQEKAEYTHVQFTS